VDDTVDDTVDDILQVRDLTISDQETPLVRGISFGIGRGEIVALVGESGSGKTLTGRAIPGLLRHTGLSMGGEIIFAGGDRDHRGGRDLARLPEPELRQVRGGQIGMIFQDPVAALDPVIRVGAQIAEAIMQHSGGPVSRAGRRARVTELLTQVGVADPELRARQFPHELSGGLCQRVLIAIALAGAPSLLIADEPTTALDVTIQAQVLDLLAGLRRERGMSVLLITHDMAVAARLADRMLVMYAGLMVEAATVADFFAAPRHPYSRALIEAVPRIDAAPVPRLPAIAGTVPEVASRPPGCAFHPRCRHTIDLCREREPALVPVADGRAAVACHLAVTR
jgi:oligopeptide/dipeptide ABC transporter ATP-binding protein